jgi:hypothetical protein
MSGATSFYDEVLGDPGVFPQNIDFFRQAVLFLRLSRAELAQASFLDDRILTPQTQGKLVRFQDLFAVLQGAPPGRPLHFIFHAGHVGSTLLSRLVGESGDVLALREPLPLRTLAEAHDFLDSKQSLVSPSQFEALIGAQLRLWSRGYGDTKAVVVKATSSAARLANRLLAAEPGAKAVYLSLDLPRYLEALLSGEHTIFDLRGHGPERIRRLEKLGVQSPTPLYEMQAGELAALAWVAEKLTENDLIGNYGARVLSVDFDNMLADIGGILRKVYAHYDFVAPESRFADAARSAVLQRYSKNPEAQYSPALRAEVMQETRQQRGGEIKAGLNWVDKLALRAPSVARLLVR